MIDGAEFYLTMTLYVSLCVVSVAISVYSTWKLWLVKQMPRHLKIPCIVSPVMFTIANIGGVIYVYSAMTSTTTPNFNTNNAGYQIGIMMGLFGTSFGYLLLFV